MRFREASASELLLRCRNEMDDVKTGGLTDLQDKSRRDLFTAWAASGIKGSANLIQALVWNVGTCRLDVKGEIQVEDPRE